MTRALRLLALVPLLASTGCGSAGPDDGDQLASADGAADALVVQVRQVGGFVPVGWDFRSVPTASVYSDGRVIAPGPEIAAFPGPALPSVQVGQLPPEQVRQLVEEGRAVLGSGTDYGQPPIADAPTTVVAVGAGDDREVVSAAALAEAGTPAPDGEGLAPPGTDGLTPEQQRAREDLRQYVARVRELAGSVTTSAFEPEGLAVLALPYGDEAALEAEPPEPRTWPGPALADGQELASGRCVVVRQELDDVRDAAAQATQETPWVDSGRRWRLAFRPLLPHERTCGDVLAGPAPVGP